MPRLKLWKSSPVLNESQIEIRLSSGSGHGDDTITRFNRGQRLGLEVEKLKDRNMLVNHADSYHPLYALVCND